MTPDHTAGTSGDGQAGGELATRPDQRQPEITLPSTPDGGDPEGRRRGLWVAVLIAVAVVTVLAGGAMLLRDDDDTVDTADTVDESDAGDEVGDADEGDAPDDAAPPTDDPVATEEPVPDGPPVPGDGRHPVYLTAIDVGARSIAFDEIEFLVGEEATAAYRAHEPDAVDGPPNDYFIVNDEVEVIAMPVADQVEVTIVDWAGSLESQPVAFEALPDALADDPVPDDSWLWPTPFWLTVADGTVTGIEQQYLP
jgi:hypothetical protein